MEVQLNLDKEGESLSVIDKVPNLMISEKGKDTSAAS